MVYSPNKVVACVKVDGKILREDKNVVTLPFGSEYSVFVKNLNASRVKIKVSVDGTDATSGTWLVVEPNSDLDLERFIRDGNWDSGNRFKFIERTSAIEEGPRGIKADDGLIRIEYQVEIIKPKPIIVEEHHHHHDHWDRPSSPWRYGGDFKKSSMPTRSRSLRPASADLPNSENLGFYSYEFPVDALETDSLGDVGITVPGSKSNQSFRSVRDFESGPSEVIVLQLRGCVAGKLATKAVTVQTKLKCVTCGKTQKSTEKFCGQCGTALEIL